MGLQVDSMTDKLPAKKEMVDDESNFFLTKDEF